MDIYGPTAVHWTRAYTTSNGARQGSGAAQDSPTGNAGPGTVDCDGAITVTLQWNRDGVIASDPAGDPPKYAVLVKEGAASWSGSSGSCNDGFDDGGPSDPNSGMSVGIHYEFLTDPGTTITRTVTPKAHAYLSSSGFYDVVTAAAAVSVKFSIVPVKVVLTGVVNSTSDHRILVGQNLGAYIDTGSLPKNSQSATCTYSWSVSGAEPFQDYVVHLTPATLLSPETPDSAEVIGFTTQTSQSLSTYLKKEEQFNVTCAFYWAWMGVTINPTEKGEAKRPTPVAFSKVIDVPNFDASSSSPVSIYLGSTTARGIEWTGNVKILSPFTSVGGRWNYVQLITPLREWDSLQPYDTRFSPNRAVNGVQGLDSAFPSQGFPTPYKPSADYYANGPDGVFGDSPSQATTNGSAYHYSRASDSFITYMLFKPDGGKYVPLKKLSWNWNAVADNGGSGTSWTFTTRTSAAGTVTDTTIHPTWTYRLDVANWSFGP